MMDVDVPFMVHESPVKRLEVRAMNALRSKYPDAPPWQELAVETRMAWLQHLERGDAAVSQAAAAPDEHADRMNGGEHG